MNGQILNPGKAVIPTSNRNFRTYTFTIRIPKIRIKVPKAKVLANAMQKKIQRVPHHGIKRCISSGSKKRWATPGKIFPKVTSIVSNVFGSNRKTRNNVFLRDAIHETNKPRGCKRFKKPELKFFKCTSANCVSNAHRVIKRHLSSSAKTARTSSRMLSSQRRNRVERTMSSSRNMITMNVNGCEQRAQDDESKDEDNWELCKKRILMGAKCKPLSLSGYLKYDKDGILLPDLLF